MDNNNSRWMETEEEAAYVSEGEGEGEGEGEDIMECGEDIMESESEGEEEEAEQLEEMKPPVVTSWTGPDGITVHGIMCIDDGIIRLKNRCQLDDCSICYKPSATHGKHQICCLPCGHTYGFSCIKKWLLQDSSSGKCPQCNAFCSFQDTILLYPSPLCVTAHQKAPPSAFFPLTKQGFREFKKYESSRARNALLLRAHDMRHANIFARQHNDLVDRADELTSQSDKLLSRADELEGLAESSGLADALRRQASPLKARIDALGRRTDALKRLASALRRRIDALKQRSDAYESRLTFFVQMYKEHHKTKKNNAPCTTCMEKKDKEKLQVASGTVEVPEEETVVDDFADEHEEEMVEEKKDKKKMQASGTLEVPEVETVEDVAEEHEEEMVEEKAKLTTKTTERLRVRSRSNKGKGPNSTSKVILKHKKSNIYMYYYAAAAAVLTVPLAVSYSLYA